MKDYDVVIVGAGPAGSAAAYHLAREGVRVALVDKSEFPREKVCGDGLITDCLAALTRMGIADTVKGLGKPSSTMELWTPSRVHDFIDILFIGETLGTTFSYTGEGIGKAMESGECASRTVL
jgi:flavin-dependent dehydrogenase